MYTDQEWLDSLKVGDMVAMGRGGMSYSYLVGNVVRITPARQIHVHFRGSYLLRFRRDGREIGGSRWSSHHIEPYTGGIKKTNQAINARYRLCHEISWDTKSDDQCLEALAWMIEKHILAPEKAE